MCDGGGGDGGGDGDVGEGGYGGTGGSGEGYGGGGGGSGGNVGGGAGPTSGSPVVAPTGRGDLPEAGGGGGGGGGSGGGGGWEEATTLAGKNKSDPALGNMLSGQGAFGFTPNQGLTTGMIAGSMFPGLSIPFGLGGYLAGFATDQGQSVDDYGGGTPTGGGPLSPDEYEAQRLADETGPSRGGDEGFISTMLGGGGSGGSAGGGDEGDDTGQSERGFGLSLSSDPDDGFRKYKRNVGDSELLKTLIFNEDEFTENLF
jgi:hypothetical protein